MEQQFFGDVWFGRNGNARCSVEVDFVDHEGEDDGYTVEFEFELYVTPWERSAYRPTERDFEVEDVVLFAHGREYHFDLEDVFEQEVDRDRFMAALERAYDEHAAECFAEAYL